MKPTTSEEPATTENAGTCRLCRREGPLRRSHVIPAFVSRWIKATSATGFMRGYETPNRPLQDFPTERLLCADCEEKLSASEHLFASRVFYPYHEGRSTFEYEDWFLRFAVSLAWRCAVTSHGTQDATYPQHVDPLECAKAAWAAFLLARSDSITPYRFDLFFTPLGASSTGVTLPEGFSWYMLRGADLTPVFSTRRAAMYVKLPGMIFWTYVNPPNPGGWRGTRIGRHGTFRARKQTIADGSVGQFLKERVEAIYARLSNVSANQRNRIEAAVTADPERAARSKSLEAWLDAQRIRRETGWRE